MFDLHTFHFPFNLEHSHRLEAVNRACEIFQRQCRARKIARSACLRELIEGSLFYYGYLFGQYEEPVFDELKIPEHEMVLLQNQKQSLGPNSNRSILHAGVIGRGLRQDNMSTVIHCPQEEQILFLKALDVCCWDYVRIFEICNKSIN